MLSKPLSKRLFQLITILNLGYSKAKNGQQLEIWENKLL